MSRKKLFFIAIIAFALLLRLAGIFSRPIWYDEAFSLLVARGNFSLMIQALQADVHPLGYYISLWGWGQIFGNSIAAARGFSVLTGMFDLFILFLIAREVLKSELFLTISAVLLAISPFLIHYQQEIRMYSLMSLFLHMTTLAYLKAEQKGTILWWGIFAFSSALAQHIQSLSAFYLVTLATTPLLKKDWKTSRSLFFSGLAAILLYLPWAISQMIQVKNIQSYWIEKPGLAQIVNTLLSYVTNLPIPAQWLSVSLVMTLWVVIFTLFQTIKTKNNKVGLWLAYLSFTPTALLFLVSQWKPLYIERATLASGGGFLLWVAWMLSETRPPKLIQALTLSFMLIGAGMGFFQHINYQNFPYAPFQKISNMLVAEVRSGAIILHANKLTALPIYYFAPRLPNRFLADPAGAQTDTLSNITQNIIGLEESVDIESATQGASRVYLILFKRDIDEYRSAGIDEHPSIVWLKNKGKLLKTNQIADIILFTFELGTR